MQASGKRSSRSRASSGEDADPPGRAVVLQTAQEAGDALDEGLAADEADGGIGAHLMGEVLAGTEADLEPEVLDRRPEQSAQVDGRLRVLGKVDPERGQARSSRA